METFASSQSQALGSLLLGGYETGHNVGLVFFAFHLLILGYLVFRSGYIPTVFGVLVFISGLGYLVDSVGTLLFPQLAGVFEVIGFTTVIGGVPLMFWLLIKGVRDKPSG